MKITAQFLQQKLISKAPRRNCGPACNKENSRDTLKLIFMHG